MLKLITASVASFCLFVLANACHAQTTNVNRINGNGNTVINSTRTTPTPAPAPTPTQPSAGRVRFVEVPSVQYVPAIQQVECVPGYCPPAPVAYLPSSYVAPAPYGHVPQPMVGGGRSLPSVNLNINAINGNNNTVANRTTGGGASGRGGVNVNINAINGNGNTVTNRTTGGSGTTNINRINGNGNTVTNRSRP